MYTSTLLYVLTERVKTRISRGFFLIPASYRSILSEEVWRQSKVGRKKKKDNSQIIVEFPN